MVPPSPSFKRPTSLRPSGLSAAFRQIPTPKRHLHPMVRAQPILNASFGLMPQGPPGNGPKGLSETVTESRGTPGHQSVKRAPRKGRFLGRLIHPTQRYALRGKRCHLRGVTDVPAIATAAEHAVGAPAAAGGGAGQLLQHVGQAHVLPRQLHKPCSKGDRERACVQLRVFGGIGFHLIDPIAQRGPRLRQLRCAAQRLYLAVPGPGHVVDTAGVGRGMVGLCAEGAGFALEFVVVEVVVLLQLLIVIELFGHRCLRVVNTWSVIVVRLRG